MPEEVGENLVSSWVPRVACNKAILMDASIQEDISERMSSSCQIFALLSSYLIMRTD